MKTRILLMVMLALCVGITSCEFPGVLTPDPVEDTVIGTTKFNLPQEGGEVEVKFIPNSSWTASCESDYVTFDPKSGEASTEEVVIAVTVAANEGEARTATLKVSFETNDVDIVINQEAKEVEQIIEQTEYAFPAEGGKVAVEFTPISDWIATCEDKWVSLSPAKGSVSDANSILTITVAKNTELKERTAMVILSFADHEETLSITQSAGDNKVKFTKTEYNVSSDGGDIEIEFVPLTRWTASTEDDFITISPSEGEASATKETVTLTVSVSELVETRTGTVVFKFENNEVNVTVNQEGSLPVVKFEKTQYDVSFKGETILFAFIPKTAWKVSTNKSFVEIATKSGEVSEDEVNLEVKVKENNTTKQRSATLTFTFENNIVEVIIDQEARPENTRISKTSYNVNADGGSVTVSFTSTTSWIAESDATFFSLSQSSGPAGPADVVLSVRPNYTSTSRNGQITFVFETNEVVVTITQASEVDSSGPSNPSNPGVPDNPSDPDNPGTPDNPDNPSDPDNPGTPDDPNNPSDPDDPDTPVDPEDPDTPVDPDDPEDPEDPTTPDAGAGTEDVNKGDDVNINNNNYTK